MVANRHVISELGGRDGAGEKKRAGFKNWAQKNVGSIFCGCGFPYVSRRKGIIPMHTKRYVLTACLLFGGVCAAKEHDYQNGTLLRMDSTSCGMQEKGSKSLTGELLGTDGQSKKTQEMLCQEYVLQTDRVVYRIRPKDDKHPALLPIGETAQFRIHKDKMILRVAESDDKEREYIVVSMTPRQDPPAQTASKN
jgi:hypothetical protein